MPAALRYCFTVSTTFGDVPDCEICVKLPTVFTTIACEAVLAAVFLEAGFETARKIVRDPRTIRQWGLLALLLLSALTLLSGPQAVRPGTLNASAIIAYMQFTDEWLVPTLEKVLPGGALEGPGAKYFQNNMADGDVYQQTKALAAQVPSNLRSTCFIIGGVPYELAKQTRNGKERYTVLDAPSAYKLDNAKSKAGLNIYKAVREATGCEQFVFDWDANFTIGVLLDLPQ